MNFILNFHLVLDVVQRRRLIASGDPGLFGDDDDDENDDENDKKEGIVHVFDDGTVKIGGDADDADEDSTALSGREKENRRKKNSAVKKPAPAKKNGNKGKKNGMGVETALQPKCLFILYKK